MGLVVVLEGELPLLEDEIVVTGKGGGGAIATALPIPPATATAPPPPPPPGMDETLDPGNGGTGGTGGIDVVTGAVAIYNNFIFML